MSTKQLPPNLASLHEQLSSRGGGQAGALRMELDAVSAVIAYTRSADPSSSALDRIDELLKKSFTGTTGGETACKCCGRPF
jgi:hypothetical protein